jgi:DNA-binding response OmpR family regulator
MLSRIFRSQENPANMSRLGHTDLAGRILMVSDASCHCELNAEMLRQHGYMVGIAGDSKAAWEKLQTNRYHLLIAEHDLPGISSVGLLKRIRSACMSLQVIMVVDTLPSWRSAEYPWFLKAGKLFKPYTFRDLLDSVKQVLAPAGTIRARIRPPGCELRSSTLGLGHDDFAPRFCARLR